jgi:hypothetical protein
LSKLHNIYSLPSWQVSRDSSVVIATGYVLGDPEIESRWVGEFFRTCPDRPCGPGYRVFPGGKERPGRDADPSPPLVPWSRKGRAIPLLPLWVVRPYRASVPVQGCILLFFYHHGIVLSRILLIKYYHLFSSEFTTNPTSSLAPNCLYFPLISLSFV